MATSRPTRVYPLAPMSGLFRWLTVGLWVLPLAFFAGAALGAWPLAFIGLFVVLVYGTVWGVFRPRGFALSDGALVISFPLRERRIPLGAVTAAEVIDARAFRTTYGVGFRIGAGGLWGGFGWLWTTRAGVMEFYISRTDGLLVIERRDGRPLLISPERPEEMAGAVRDAAAGA